MRVVLLQTVPGPSMIGSEPAFEGDVLDVLDEVGAELVANGLALPDGAPAVVAEEAVAESEPEPVVVAEPEPEAEPEEPLTDAAKERLKR